MQFLVNLEGIVTPASVERLAAVVESAAGRIVSFIPSNTLHILLPRAQLHTLHSLPGIPSVYHTHRSDIMGVSNATQLVSLVDMLSRHLAALQLVAGNSPASRNSVITALKGGKALLASTLSGGCDGDGFIHVCRSQLGRGLPSRA